MTIPTAASIYNELYTDENSLVTSIETAISDIVNTTPANTYTINLKTLSPTLAMNTYWATIILNVIDDWMAAGWTVSMDTTGFIMTLSFPGYGDEN